MPVSVEIDVPAKIVFSTFTGSITEEEIRMVGVQLTRHPDFDPSFSHIVDFQAISGADVSTEFIRAFAERMPLFNREARQVIIAPEPYMFGLARMMQILRESRLPNIEVVRSRDEAYKLLGISQRGE